MGTTATRLVVAAAIVVAAALVAELVRRRRTADAPTQPRYRYPAQLDRDDFEHPDVPWLVAVFTSETCSTCADVVTKSEVLRSDEVAVTTVSYQAREDLHQRYGIDAVPCLVVADADGVVQTGFVGPVTATDLWAALARLREGEPD
jgi:hypothetical protein